MSAERGTGIDRYLPLIVALVAATVLAFPHRFADAIAALTSLAVRHAGLPILWLSSATLVLALVLCLTPLGGRRLAEDDDAKPEFSNLAWVAMLFAAGMGSGLVFWGLAEPLSHLASPPPGLPAGPETALAVTYFHWGFHAWALYAISGLSVAWFCHRRGREDSIGAPVMQELTPGLGAATRRRGAAALDFLAIVAVLFGVAGTLGNGVDLLRIGSEMARPATALIWLLALALAFGASAWSGLERGIRLLSLGNLLLAGVLLLIVAQLVYSSQLLQLLGASSWLYLKNLPQWSVALIGGEAGRSWAGGWTVIYLLWWIAWTPFVGVFLARISTGRTLRGYLLGVIVIPTAASVLWFAVFGGGGILAEQSQAGLLTGPLADHYTAPLFAWFESLTGGDALRWMTLGLLFVFLVTSADSAVYVMAGLAGRGESARMRLLWGALLLLVAIPLVLRGDVDLNKQVAIAGAVPFTLVLILQTAALLRALGADPKNTP